MTTTVIHINQHTIRRNAKLGTADPAVTFKRKSGGKATACQMALILDEAGNVVARIVYRPHKPLPCGARCWVETELEVVPVMEVEP